MFGKILLFLALIHCAHAVLKLQVGQIEGQMHKLLREGKPHEFRAYRETHRRNSNALRHRGSRLASQPLQDYGDFVYVVNVTFGTPPQTSSLMIDTYRGDTWVVDSTCDASFCDCKQDQSYCHPKNKFDSSKSSTYKKKGQQYRDRNTGYTGILGQDTVGLASDILIPKVTFGQVSGGDFPFTYDSYDGILGLTFNETDGIKPVFQEAYDQGVITKPIFTLYLIFNNTSPNAQNGGQITYGDVDTDNCSPNVNYVPVLNQETWEFNIDSAQINGKVRTGSPWQAVVQNGASFMYVPVQVFSDIIDATNGQYDPNYGLYQVDCNTKFSWSVTIGGQEYVMDQSVLLANIRSHVCVLTFETENWGSYEFVLAQPFVKTVCQVFDVTGKIGFSPIAH